jgi:drug/metabolite transporter (DMT)-like permease
MDTILQKKWFVPIGAVLCTLLWGSAFPVIKISYAACGITTTAGQLMLAGERFFLAGVMVFVIAAIRKRRLPTVPRDKLGWAALYGLVQTGLLYIFNYIGLAHTTGTKSAILTAASAFFAVIFAPLFFKSERVTAMKLIGAVVGFSGIVIVNLGALGGGFSFFGEGFILLATVMNTVGSFIGKRISGGRVFEMTAAQLMIGGAVLLAVGLCMGGGFILSREAILPVIYLAFVSAAAFSLWTALLVYHEAGGILVYNLLIPIFGAGWSYLLLGERDILNPMVLISLVLICVGIFLVNYTKKSTKSLTSKM